MCDGLDRLRSRLATQILPRGGSKVYATIQEKASLVFRSLAPFRVVVFAFSVREGEGPDTEVRDLAEMARLLAGVDEAGHKTKVFGNGKCDGATAAGVSLDGMV